MAWNQATTTNKKTNKTTFGIDHRTKQRCTAIRTGGLPSLQRRFACSRRALKVALVREGKRRPILLRSGMKFTRYFEALRSRPDRAIILDEWIERAIGAPFAKPCRLTAASGDGRRFQRWKTAT